jgi:peptidoglycan hydrolase CwlO-like protein
MVLLLLATAWVPLASAQGAGTGASVGELSPFGRGYVEDMMLWSGAGVNLVYAPSYGGNMTTLDARMAQLGAAVNGTMPAHITPIVLPFSSADPALVGEAPLDHSGAWGWNLTSVDPVVNMAAAGSAMMAEVQLARALLAGTHDGKMGATAADAGEGVLMLLLATEAADSLAELGWNGSAMTALNLSDPNMTDADPENGWWLPAGTVTGVLNASAVPVSWEPTTATAPTLDSSVQVLRAMARLHGMLSKTPGLVGSESPFAQDALDTLGATTEALYWNIIAQYYDGHFGLFREQPVGVDAGTLSRLYLALEDVSGAFDVAGIGADAKAKMSGVAHALLDIQLQDGSLAAGYNVRAVGLVPSTGAAPLADEAWGVAALYSAHVAQGGVAYGAAAKALLRHIDMAMWNASLGLYLPDPSDDRPEVLSSDEVAVMAGLVRSIEVGGVELAMFRLAELWAGMVHAGFQLSETSATGENYSAAGNDTDGDGIYKHSMARPGRPHGVAPVLASLAEFDNATGNWTLSMNGTVDTRSLMDAALAFLPIDKAWAEGFGAPTATEENARMLLHFIDYELAQWMGERTQEIADLHSQVATMQSTVAAATAEVAAVRANMSKLLLDLNESRENVTVLNASAKWLRAKLEQTNGTVDNLTKEIEVLSDKISRLERDVTYKGENVTKLEVQLRAERNNVTQLQWKLNNATADLTDAQRDLKVAQAAARTAKDDMTAQEDRATLVGMVAFLAGLFAALIIMYLVRRSK